MPTNPPTHQRTSPMALAIDHRHGFKPTIRNRRCRLRSFAHPEPNALDLDPSNLPPRSPSPYFHRSFSTPCLSTTTSPDDSPHHTPRVEIISARRTHLVHALVVEAAIAMASGSQPVLAPGGLGGAYYLRNRAGESFAVVKPVDEEPLALNNPKGFTGRTGLGRSVRVGESGIREVAAYLLDHGGFSGVPPTALIKISHPVFHVTTPITGAPPRKIASIQRFVPHDYDAGELGPSRFSVYSVHRIGILDVRLLNIDRHAGNILVKKRNGSYDSYCNDAATDLVPIDHGLCLPEILEDPYFEWLHWPQAAVPFSESEAEYICALDPFRDAELLRAELPLLRESCIRVLVLCSIFLKRAAEAGLCLADIGDMMTRESCGVEEGPSTLETLCKQVESSVYTGRLMEDERKDHSGGNDIDEAKGFQFDMDCEDEAFTEEVVDVPLILRSKPPKGPTKSSSTRSIDHHRKLVLLPLDGEDDDEDDGDDSRRDESKVGGLLKSVSFSVADLNYEYGEDSGAKCVSFKRLSEEEWGLFLDKFEELLPAAFETRKCLGFKQRLGSSCKF